MAKLITYAESEGKPKFDWNAFLSKTEITRREWNHAINMAESWVTCACGNQCDIIPRNNNGCPIDEKLGDLGGSNGFYGAIKNEDRKEALRLLNLGTNIQQYTT